MKLAILLSFIALASGRTLWNDIRVTWNLNPFSDGFQSVKNLNSKTMIANYCTTSGSPFKGVAYAQNNDKTIVVLYDVKGNVAGMQSFTPDNVGWTPPTGAGTNYFVHQNGYYIQTVYFMDPSKICTTGRTDSSKTGEGLWIQEGSTTPTYHQIPNKETGMSGTPWANTGKCFWTMGQHYWYNVHKNMACEDMVPYCLLYDDGSLTGFCFAVNGALTDDYYDSPHPTTSVLSKFMADVPSCMNAQNPRWSQFSTIHVYFTDSPRSTFC